ncbi:hypothetical protein [Macrococcoides caseolyticum]|uniref:hypothetical protein n=1 Tax=Macrococcoides caseolyticum TaxID=69966 RepID=UPI001F3162C8|nr:hypothetical protein [Macrococcus caseolyticus]MCE4956953.1 hypothetical protein [Macrococcus caseolyticus]
MRIQMRLSYEARVVLEEIKLNYLKEGVKKTSGSILDDIFKDFKNRVNEIDWDFIIHHAEYTGILADYTEVNPTTLNLSKETIEIIEVFRDFLNMKLNMKRTVYRSYIIRVVLKAYKIELEGTNINL